MRLTAAPLLLLLVLAGCATAPPAPSPSATPLPAAAADTCGARAHAGLLGQPATALERQLVLRPVRLLRDGPPGPVRPDRLTFHIATPPGTPADRPPRLAERITAISCG